jgi:hypothetical protein
VLLAKQSSLVNTNTSPALSAANALARAARSVLAPLCFSLKTFLRSRYLQGCDLSVECLAVCADTRVSINRHLPPP